jgi:hypothetical protein
VAKRRKPGAPKQGTLFGPADVYGGVTPAVSAERPDLESPCGVCGHPLGRHTAQGEGLCLDCDCGGWVPPRPAAWDDGLTPPTPEELAALRAAHPGVMLLFRHQGGCAFHGDDVPVALGLLSLSPGGPPDRPWVGWPHGDFERHMRRLLRAGKVVCVVERGEGLPPGHRLGVCPVVTPFTEVGEEAEGG